MMRKATYNLDRSLNVDLLQFKKTKKFKKTFCN